MASRTRKKLFYDLNDVAVRLELSFVDIGVLLAERQIRLCTPVAGLPVEVGIWENEGCPDGYAVPEDRRLLTGLVDLRPQDALAVVRSGSGMLLWLDAPAPGYRRVIGFDPERPGHEVTRDDLGIRHEDLERIEAMFGGADDAPERPAAPRGRGIQPTHDWDACQLEVFRLFYFEGVPESKAALIRHVQAWFGEQGRKVPDESTLQKRLKDIWAMFAPEARRKTA
jgi:hypothetical protein